MHTLIVICSFCKKFMDIKDGQGESGNSHGICDVCLKTVFDDMGLSHRFKSKEKMIDTQSIEVKSEMV